jgi:hypothetical protein
MSYNIELSEVDVNPKSSAKRRRRIVLRMGPSGNAVTKFFRASTSYDRGDTTPEIGGMSDDRTDVSDFWSAMANDDAGEGHLSLDCA